MQQNKGNTIYCTKGKTKQQQYESKLNPQQITIKCVNYMIQQYNAGYN